MIQEVFKAVTGIVVANHPGKESFNLREVVDLMGMAYLQGEQSALKLALSNAQELKDKWAKERQEFERHYHE